MDRVAYYLCYHYYYFIDNNKNTHVKITLLLKYCVWLTCLGKTVGNPYSNLASKRTGGLSPQLCWH